MSLLFIQVARVQLYYGCIWTAFHVRVGNSHLFPNLPPIVTEYHL